MTFKQIEHIITRPPFNIDRHVHLRADYMWYTIGHPVALMVAEVMDNLLDQAIIDELRMTQI